MPMTWRRWCASTLSSITRLNPSFTPPRRIGRSPIRAWWHLPMGATVDKGLEMHRTFINGLAAGYERIVAWADILDRINVYPVPDGDTGRNLVITLSALRDISGDPDSLSREILLSARGNSGNIAARFLAGFLNYED